MKFLLFWGCNNRPCLYLDLLLLPTQEVKHSAVIDDSAVVGSVIDWVAHYDEILDSLRLGGYLQFDVVVPAGSS